MNQPAHSATPAQTPARPTLLAITSRRSNKLTALVAEKLTYCPGEDMDNIVTKLGGKFTYLDTEDISFALELPVSLSMGHKICDFVAPFRRHF